MRRKAALCRERVAGSTIAITNAEGAAQRRDFARKAKGLWGEEIEPPPMSGTRYTRIRKSLSLLLRTNHPHCTAQKVDL
ncbi:MAG: hypothetical protein ACR5LD_03310 [Symbiopectobacterium sp.]